MVEALSPPEVFAQLGASIEGCRADVWPSQTGDHQSATPHAVRAAQACDQLGEARATAELRENEVAKPGCLQGDPSSQR